MKEAKEGRPRQIDFVAYAEAKDKGIGYIIAILDEASERVVDQIEDLPVEALNFIPEGSYLSIGKVVLHQIQDEARCVSKDTGTPVPEVFRKELATGGKEDLGKPLDPPQKAGELISLCRRLREEYTKPSLSALKDIDAPVESENVLNTVRKELMHLIWHWIWHSGHVGLTRLLWGSEYNWRY